MLSKFQILQLKKKPGSICHRQCSVTYVSKNIKLYYFYYKLPLVIR